MVVALEQRQFLSTSTTLALASSTPTTQQPVVAPSHVVVVIEEDRFANAIGDTTNMPYINSLAASGLAYTNSHGLNTSSQDGEMSYLGLYSGSTQGVTDDGDHGIFTGSNLAQSLYNKGLTFSGFAESLPHAGDMTDDFAAEPGNPAYDDLYVRAYNPMAQFSNVGTGITNAMVNQPFSSFPTTAAGFASLPTVSIVVPNTLHNTHGSNDTSPYATDPSEYNYLRQNADSWLKTNIDPYLQWAKQNNSLLIITGDEGDRAHTFANGFATIVNGSSNLFVPGVDTTNETPYNILRTIENMYGLSALGGSASVSGLDIASSGKLGASTLSGTSVVGQSVKFTATVTAASGTTKPTGTVQFQINGVNFGSAVTVSGGIATSSATAFASAGTESITATYTPSGSFSGSMAPKLTQIVNPDSTATSLSLGTPSSVWGQSVKLTATVAAVSPGAGTPTGTVNFLDNGVVIGSATLSSGVATLSTTSLAVGSGVITTQYVGNASDLSSTSAASTETVGQDGVSMVVASTPNPATQGTAVTITVTVAASAPGAGIPTGVATFYDGSTVLGTMSLNSSGVAKLTTSSLSVGTHTLSVQYGGDTHFLAGASTTLSQLISGPTSAPTSISISSSANPAVAGQPVILTATVSPLTPGVTPTGTVLFSVDGQNVGSAVALGAAGTATISLTTLAPGAHSITAGYSGDNTYAPSNNNLSQVVNLAGTSVTISPSVNPTVVGQSAVFTAQVAVVAPGAGAPTGSVSFYDGATLVGTSALNAAGQSQFASAALAEGAHTITAVYNGDANFLASPASTAIIQTVSQAATTIAIASSANPAGSGASVTFTASLAIVAPGAGTPTGTITFYDGATSIGSSAINAGQATFTTSSLSAGATHSITAVYSGDANFTTSTSSALSEVVQAAPAAPTHIVVVIEETRFANAIGDVTNMPYTNQLASSGLVFSDTQGLNSSTQTGQMNFLALYSGSTQGVTTDGDFGMYTGGNLAQSLAGAKLSFSGYDAGLPAAGDTTDDFAAEPGNAAYDDFYIRAENPMAQFSNVGTGITNAMVNQPFSSFPTTSAGFASLPTVSFVVPDTLHNTKGSNDTSPYATDPGSYNLLRQNADSWLQQNIGPYEQWAAQNNSLLIVYGEEGDRQHTYANGSQTIIAGSTNFFTAGTNSTAIGPYNILRTIGDYYGLTPLGGAATATDLVLNPPAAPAVKVQAMRVAAALPAVTPFAIAVVSTSQSSGITPAATSDALSVATESPTYDIAGLSGSMSLNSGAGSSGSTHGLFYVGVLWHNAVLQ